MQMTVGQLIQDLKSYHPDTEICFQGELEFYRTKIRGKNLVQIEFNEYQAFLSEELRMSIPGIKVVFCEHDAHQAPFRTNTAEDEN